MSISAITHLNFRGNAREALTVYQSVFGGQVMIATYADVGVPQDSTNTDRAVFAPVPPDSPDADHVAFGVLAAENGLRLAAYDVFGTNDAGVATAQLADASTRAAGLTHTEEVFLLLNGDTLDEINPFWDALSDQATVIQELAPADWAPAYGMLTDRFGVTWIFGVTPA